MKTLFTTVSVLLVCGGCGFEVIGLNGPYDNTSLKDGRDGWLNDKERREGANGDVRCDAFVPPPDVDAVDVSPKTDTYTDPDIKPDTDITDDFYDFYDADSDDESGDTQDAIDASDADATEVAEEMVEEVDIFETTDPCEGVDCDDDNNCTKDFCVTGECVNEPIADCCLSHTECDDNNICDGIETCVDNKCHEGEALKCDDDNVCTDDSCDSSDGCVYTPNLMTCDDTDPCTAEDTCTEDKQCVGKLWCVCFSDAECLDDGNLCNGTYKCQGNFCVIDPNTVVKCADDDPCTKDSCNPDTGECSHETIADCCHYDSECDDKDVCNGLETCDGGKCTTDDICYGGFCQSGTPIKCDDDNVCTNDACDSMNGCIYTPNFAACDDNDPCTINDTCQDKACVGTTVPCECQSTADCAKLEDGNLCNGTLKCQDMICIVNESTIIEWCTPTENPCTANVCNPDTGECEINIVNGNACDDGVKCTTGDTCFNGVCQSGADVSCDDKNVCTDDSCDQSNGKCVYTPKPYDDSNPCTTDSCDPIWGESHLLKDCNDNNVCTTDACNPSTGFCVNTAIADCCNSDKECDNADKCDGAETCVGHQCVPSAPLVCDDGNECTGDICIPAAGCVPFNLPNNIPCDDKDACTNGDTCQAGKCKGGPALMCNDGNACTTDSCDPAVGCIHNIIICNDSNVCTTDSCKPSTGCEYAKIAGCCLSDGECDDGIVCNGPETCVANTCINPKGDVDCDNVLDVQDNCQFVSNPDQADVDADKIGDACDLQKNCVVKMSTRKDYLPPSQDGYEDYPCIAVCLTPTGKYACLHPINVDVKCNADVDKDGWSMNAGDCNDQNGNVKVGCWPNNSPPLKCPDAGWTVEVIL